MFAHGAVAIGHLTKLAARLDMRIRGDLVERVDGSHGMPAASRSTLQTWRSREPRAAAILLRSSSPRAIRSGRISRAASDRSSNARSDCQDQSSWVIENVSNLP